MLALFGTRCHSNDAEDGDGDDDGDDDDDDGDDDDDTDYKAILLWVGRRSPLQSPRACVFIGRPGILYT